MIGQQVLSYRILRQLGAGGMGVVYEAEDSRLGRRVALKFLPPSLSESSDASARFEREARILSSLNHPNICTIHDICTVSEAGHDRRFIVMELLEGESLRSRINGHPMPIDLVVEVSSQIADALDAAHDKGIVHRDIKPANIFITKRGQAKLLDFGVAKPGGEAGGLDEETHAAAEQLTMPGTTVGSINYMSPEQARGQAIDGRSDIFSLGLVLYEMATGRQAFSGATSAVVYDAILNRQPAPAIQVNADVPVDLDHIIARSLEKDARLRYQTAGDLVAELRRLRRDTDARRVGLTGSVTAAATASISAATMTAAPLPTTHVATAPASVTSAPAIPAAPARTRSRIAFVGVPAVLVLGVTGFWLWNSTRTPAFTERDVVVVADFANSTGDAVFDDALKQAVSVQLQQTAFVTLLPDRQVQNTLALMQRKSDEALTGAVARELCQRAGARATVEGSIAPLGSSYVIALGVHDCQSGAAIAQEQTQADSKEGVLKAVGGAVTALRKRLGESLASIAKNDVPAEATTSSLEALRAYGLGLKARMKADDAAIPFFQQAIEKDPNFALAHAKLSTVFSNIGRRDDAKAETQKAYDLREKVSEYERLYILWAYYSRVDVNDAKQKEMLDVLIATYPRDFAGHNNLGTYYLAKGKLDDALTQFMTAHESGPSEPLPVSNATFVHFLLGRYDEGIKMAELSMTLRPTAGVAVARWMRAHLQGDPREATFHDAAVKYGTPDNLLQVEQSLAMWDGRMMEVTALQRKLVEFFRANNRADALASGDMNYSIAQGLLLGGPALDNLKKVIALPGASRQLVEQAAIALAARTGDVSAARRELPRAEKEPGPSPSTPVRPGVIAMRAYVLSADGKADEALAALQGMVTEDPRNAGIHFNIGQIQERAGRVDDAIASYRRVTTAAAALGSSMTVPLTRLSLARLLVQKGDAAGAKTEVDILTKQWEHADPDFLPALELKKLTR